MSRFSCGTGDDVIGVGLAPGVSAATDSSLFGLRSPPLTAMVGAVMSCVMGKGVFGME